MQTTGYAHSDTHRKQTVYIVLIPLTIFFCPAPFGPLVFLFSSGKLVSKPQQNVPASYVTADKML